MKIKSKLLAFFCVIFISLSLFVPVFAASSVSSGSSSSSTTISDPSQFNDLDRSIGPQFSSNSKNVVCPLNTSNYLHVDYQANFAGSYIYTLPLSLCPQAFCLAINSKNSTVYIYNDTALYFTFQLNLNSSSSAFYNIVIDGNIVNNGLNPRESILDLVLGPQSMLMLKPVDTTTNDYGLVFTANPQDWVPSIPEPFPIISSDAFSPFYYMLSNSGVNEEWSSIGVVVLASILCLSLVIFIFKICFGKR